MDGVRGGIGATLGMRTASGVETFGVETFGGDDLKRAGGGVDGRGGVRGLGGGDVASTAALTGRSGLRTRCAPERSGDRARCGLRTWNDRPSGCGKPTVICHGSLLMDEDVRARQQRRTTDGLNLEHETPR